MLYELLGERYREVSLMIEAEREQLVPGRGVLCGG